MIALDGAKLKADASLGSNKTYEQFSKEEERLGQKVGELLFQA